MKKAWAILGDLTRLWKWIPEPVWQSESALSYKHNGKPNCTLHLNHPDSSESPPPPG
jgi:hypothetical protein